MALPPQETAFHHGLRELGWVEGQNLTIEWRWAEGRLERFATLVDEVVRLPVEVMVVLNQLTTQVAQQATTTIPIIIAGGGALAQSVPTLAQPGGNVTGMAEFLPVSRWRQRSGTATMWPKNPGIFSCITVDREAAAQSLSITLVPAHGMPRAMLLDFGVATGAPGPCPSG